MLKKCRQSRFVKQKRRALAYCPQKKGTCTRVHKMTPKKPCSALRSYARVKLSNTMMVTCHIPGERHELKRFSSVLVRGGRTNDMPGVKYKIIRGVEDSRPVYLRRNSRSRYGVQNAMRFHRIRATRGVGRKVTFK